MSHRIKIADYIVERYSSNEAWQSDIANELSNITQEQVSRITSEYGFYRGKKIKETPLDKSFLEDDYFVFLDSISIENIS